MSLFPVGILIALASFAAAISHLNQGVRNYFDWVALLMVFGGTLAVGVILIPWHLRKDLSRSLMDLIRPFSTNHKDVLNDCITTLRNRQAPESSAATNEIYLSLLRDGVELLNLGFPAEKIRFILTERLHAYGRQKRKIANAVRSLAKYPPAFGLMGTVLGLVNVMRNVSNGGDGKQTALEMAIALVATMYGLVIANLFVNPAGELILKRTVEQESYGEIAVEAMILFAENVSLLESQEVLNSFVPNEQRISVISEQFEAKAA